tara:strand:+ start:6385 stop:7413 length:1029 start_codon:yes stop_codon:yes gene_type:complete
VAPIELDPIPDPNYPDGSHQGSFEGAGHSYERSAGELLHRPHAFALMHGDGGAKVAYGELHYRVDSFELKFNQQDLTCTIADHADHAHEHVHTHEHDHHHSFNHTHGVTSHTHTIDPATVGSSTHDHGGSTGSTVTNTGSPSTTNTDSPNESTTDNPNESTTSGVKATDGSTYSGSSGNLSHTCTISPAQITYCSGAKQAGIGNITQVTPKIGPEPAEASDWKDMDPTIPSIYHQLVGYGDVYLCWKVNTENVANEVEKCWVQVGDPTGNAIGGITMGTTTTDRRAAGVPNDATGQPEGGDEGVYKIKLGTVTEDALIDQNVSNDVSWNTVVMDRFHTTNSP